ncbi:PDGLE domain-containing protein [Rhodococcus phenolicus]|uniref:PDGLE domain-containing protein n=1 Tax=Rhodococcus phenolicus TaxID=263849 RepID=UPI0008352769|nr:PDGLE domain-containing protein [Rhodococcus phenolicus]
MSRRRVLLALAVVTLLIAGVLSYLASSSPDGLDSTTLRGCEVVEIDGTEHLTGECIATDATDHTLTGSPLADYAVGGREFSTGLAGIAGVVVVAIAAGGLFRLLGRRRSPEEAAGR